MSRFFATGDTDTESSAESSEEEIKPTGPIRRPQYIFSDDDDEDEKRVVRSAKDKRYDELKDIIRAVNNSQKIKDVAKVQTGFESLQKAFQKAKGVIEKEGETPGFYIKALVDVEDFIKDLWEDKEAKAKLSKINARALAGLKQKVRKYNKDFEAAIELYREDPSKFKDEEEVDEDAESEDDDESDDVLSPVHKEPKPVATKELKSDEESDDDSIEWDMTESSSSSSESDEGPGGYYTVEYFLKKDKTKEKQEGKARRRAAGEAKKKTVKFTEEDDKEDDSWTVVQRGKAPGVLSSQEMKKMMFGKGEVDVDHDVIKKKRDEILSARGKKTTERSENIEHLKILLQLSKEAGLGIGMELLLLVDIVAVIYDIPSVVSCMKDDVWQSCLQHMDTVVTLLETHPEVELCLTRTDDEENFKDPERPYKIHGSILVFVEKMDDEFVKVLQATDAHSTEFVTKLQYEAKVTELIIRVQKYLEERGDAVSPEELCRIYIKRIEHIYYKIDRKHLVKASKPAAESTEEGGERTSEVQGDDDDEVVMARLTKFIYNCEDSGRIRTRAMLCHIYHHALHDHWFQAKDLMLMSHLQENIQFADVPTQVLYNRALVQLGMCAFRHGMIKDAHDALMDIQSSGRSKELLAQGPGRQDRSHEQETLERRRQIPFHMHINLELMECVYLTAAMLLEIPAMASAEREGRRRRISKSFHYQLKNREKQPLVGPPDSMREHVVAAAHAMMEGDWKMCNEYILSIKAWDLFINGEDLKQMLTSKIKEETLRTFIFKYGETYDSLSVERLAEMFEMSVKEVHGIVSKMIFKEEILASLDEPTQMIVMHHAIPNKLQCQALLLSENIGTLSDYNEELMKLKHAGPWNMAAAQQGGSYKQSQTWQQKHRRQAPTR